MRGIFKKITSVIAVASLAASAGSLTAFADEAQPFELAEDDYYICDDLDISKEDVSDIIDKVNDMYLSGEITAEIAEDMVNAFSASANEDTYKYLANDFFLAVPVKSGITLTESNKITFKIPRTAPDYRVRLYNVNSKLCLGNAVPTLTKDNISAPEYSSETVGNVEVAKFETHVNNAVTTTNEGVLFSLRIEVQDASGNSTLGGQRVYNMLRGNPNVSVEIDGVPLKETNYYSEVDNDNDNNNNYYDLICSLGDIDNNGIVDVDDKQMLIDYLLHNRETLSPMQFAAADVTENGEVDVRDYSRLRSYISGVYTNLRSINS